MTQALNGFAVMRRNGDIFMVAVDPEDYERVMAAGPWYVMQGGRTWYAARDLRTSGKPKVTLFLHTFILGVKGIDHVDGNGLNNCQANLRPATQSENLQNQRLRRNSQSGYRGVCFDRQRSKWLAQVGGSNLGRYANAEAAHQAVCEYRARHYPFSADARAAEAGARLGCMAR